MMCKIYRTCMVLVTLAAILVSGSYAAMSGVAINDAVKGNIYDFVFTVKNPSSNTTNYSIVTNGKVTSWIFVDKTNVTLNASSSVDINGKIKIPDVIDSGIYTGNLTVEAVGNVTNNTSKTTIIPININVLGEPTVTSTAPKSTPTSVSTPSNTPSETPVKTPGFGLAIAILATSIIYVLIVRNKK